MVYLKIQSVADAQW